MTTTLTPTQANALKIAVDAVLDAVKAAGDRGAPGGIIYAALMQHGASFSQYESLMGALVLTGRLRREDDLYFVA